MGDRALLTTPRTMALCTVAGLVAVLVLRDPAPLFVFDAAQYWSGAQAVVSGADVYHLGGLNARGVVTALVYVPAALAIEVLGLDPLTTGTVLVQNALAIAVLGAVVVPLVLRRLMAIGPTHVALSTTLTVLLLSGFAPYPIMDLAALVALVLGLLLVAHRPWWLLAAGGVMFGIAVNLRPAYLVPVLGVCLLLVVHRRLWALVPVLGAGAPLAFQAWYGWRATELVTLWPPDTAIVTSIQLMYASYGVRYDTIPYTAEDPRRWYCSPDMAEHAVGNLPETTGQLAAGFVSSLPESALFAVEKVAATLQWSWTTPYSSQGRESLQLLGILACATVALGLIALIVMSRASTSDRFMPQAVVLSALGCAVVIVGAAPESRFALPIVVAGVIGVCAATSLVRPRHRLARTVLLTAVVVTGLTMAVGAHGLSKPAPRGDVTAETCQALASSAPAM